ncbi:MAG: FAD/NAD(P)-binding protein [Gelidibacter sp.]
MDKHHVALVGSGPTGIYLLKHISDNAAEFTGHIQSISIFEKSETGGMGMPYNPEMTDIYNLANISSEEIPMLKTSYADWLSAQPKKTLKTLNITEYPIKKTKVYSRISLGYYFSHQYNLIIADLKKSGFDVNEHLGTKVIDIVPDDSTNQMILVVQNSKTYSFSKVIIATGHIWPEKDQPEHGYYGSPWPIQKLLPKKNENYNYTIGTLGASLSAFDVVTSLAHRHGQFVESSKGLEFILNEEANKFKIVMHSAEGWLPHLQYEQEKPIREIYRHTTRHELLSLIDENGFLPFNKFFDVVCRPAIIRAFERDDDKKLVRFLNQADYSVLDFIEEMESKHDYINSFEGMRNELAKAKSAAKHNEPVHWMETLDDLMYCLNFHSELLSAEDHKFFRKKMMPFLMNVIAALPLSSAAILLALYDADCITLKEGSVEILEHQNISGKTIIEVTDKDSKIEKIEYNMFVNCSGQGKLEFDDYPFASLVEQGIVRKASAKFRELPDKKTKRPDEIKNILFTENDAFWFTGGIDVDAGYRVIKKNGSPDERIHDISFIHTAGCRPYSYGLQACNATSLILLEQWKKSIQENLNDLSSIEATTKTYENNEGL